MADNASRYPPDLLSPMAWGDIRPPLPLSQDTGAVGGSDAVGAPSNPENPASISISASGHVSSSVHDNSRQNNTAAIVSTRNPFYTFLSSTFPRFLNRAARRVLILPLIAMKQTIMVVVVPGLRSLFALVVQQLQHMVKWWLGIVLSIIFTLILVAFVGYLVIHQLSPRLTSTLMQALVWGVHRSFAIFPTTICPSTVPVLAQMCSFSFLSFLSFLHLNPASDTTAATPLLILSELGLQDHRPATSVVDLYADLRQSSVPLAECQVMECSEIHAGSILLQMEIEGLVGLDIKTSSALSDTMDWLYKLDQCARDVDLVYCQSHRSLEWAVLSAQEAVERLIDLLNKGAESLTSMSPLVYRTLRSVHAAEMEARTQLNHQTWAYSHKLNPGWSSRVNSLRSDLDFLRHHRGLLQNAQMYLDNEMKPRITQLLYSSVILRARLDVLSKSSLRVSQWHLGLTHWLSSSDGDITSERKNLQPSDSVMSESEDGSKDS